MGNYFTKVAVTQQKPSVDPCNESTTKIYVDTALITPITVYGWKRDNIDSIDVYHHFDYYTFMTTPIVDMRSAFPPVHNQLPINGTASAVASLYEFASGKCTSQTFVYYKEKDPGVSIRDAIQMFNKSAIQLDMKHGTELRCERLAQDIDYLRQCLCEGIPFVFGFSVYESFKSDLVAESGIMTMPKEGDKLLGWHAVVAVGFNDVMEHFIIRNSWGDKWGDGGYFYMPYNFMTNPALCSDFWLLTSN